MKIVYPAPSSTTWPLWIAKEGGIFEKNGLSAAVDFALHPAGPAAVISGEALTHNLGLDTAMLAAMRGDQVVIIGSPLLVGQFALVGAKAITDAKSLERKRIAVGRVGDPPYFYALGVLDALKVDTKGMQWIPAGRAAAAGAVSAQRPRGRRHADVAGLLPAAGGRLQRARQTAGFPADPDRDELHVPPPRASETPHLVEAFLKSHIEAVKRIYDDKPFVWAC